MGILIIINPFKDPQVSHLQRTLEEAALGGGWL